MQSFFLHGLRYKFLFCFMAGESNKTIKTLC